MPTIKDWSTTPGNNDQSLTGIDWDENMLPSQVNNSARDTLAQIAQFVKDVYAGVTQYSLDQGAVNAYVIIPTPAITAYAAGQTFAFKTANGNSGASTLKVSDLTVKSILRYDGTALAGGDIPSGGIVVVVYDGANFRAVSPLGAAVKDADNTFTGANVFSGANTLSGANIFSGANSFSGNNTHSGTETFTGDVEVDDADLEVSITTPTSTAESAGFKIHRQKKFVYRVTGWPESTNKQMFKLNIPNTVDVSIRVDVVALQDTDGNLGGGTARGSYSVRNKWNGLFGTLVSAEGLGYISLAAPVVSGRDIIFGASYTHNGTTTTATVDFYITVTYDSTANWTFTGLPGTTANSVAGLSNANIFGFTLAPYADDTRDIGTSGRRVQDLFIVNSPTVGSDSGLKDEIGRFDDKVLDAVGAVPIETFKWKNAIAAKGRDKARFHAGVVAQNVVAAFEARGLDAGDYGVYVKAQDEDGKERLMVRPTELLFMENARLRRELDRVEARLAALEGSPKS